MDALIKAFIEAVLKYLGVALKGLLDLLWRFTVCPMKKLIFPVKDARSGLRQSRMRYYRVELTFPSSAKATVYQEVDSNGNVVGYFDDNGSRFIAAQPNRASVTSGGFFQFPSWGRMHWGDVFNGEAGSGCRGISERQFVKRMPNFSLNLDASPAALALPCARAGQLRSLGFMAQYWHIAGFDSTKRIFEMKVKVGCLSDGQLKALLMALAAKAGLAYDEIVGAYAKRGCNIANELLHVYRDGPYPIYSCGTNPHFIARVVTDDGA